MCVSVFLFACLTATSISTCVKCPRLFKCIMPLVERLTVGGNVLSRRTIDEKLHNIPIFAVTTARGSPYLSRNNEKDQSALLFF